MRKEDKNSSKASSLLKKREAIKKKKAAELLLIRDLALQSLLHAVAIADLDGKIIHVNKAWMKLWGYDDEKQISGRHISEFAPAKELLNKAVLSVQQGNVYIGEDVSVNKEGIPFDFQISANLVKSPDGKPIFLMACFLDITKRKRMEESLKESHDRFSRLVNQLNDVVWRATPDGQILDLNKSFEDIYGISATEFVTNPNLWIEMTHPDDRIIAEESAKELLTTGNSVVEYRIVRPNGEIRWLHDRKSLLYDGKGNPLEIGGFATDITQRKQLEEKIRLATNDLEQQVKERTSELEDSYKKIQTLASHIQDIREEERITISREIHDEIGNLLIALKLEIEDLIDQKDKLNKPLINKLIPLTNLVDAAFDSVRKVITALRPEVLDHFGLIPAMKWQIQQSQIRKKTEYESNFGIKNYSFSKYESTTLFRIFQEIISNISRHSDATKVYISFKEENDQIILEVKDNGIGFEMNKLEQIDSFGLIGMRERALSIGAELTIESFLTMGTTVTLLLKKKQNESKNQGDD